MLSCRAFVTLPLIALVAARFAPPAAAAESALPVEYSGLPPDLAALYFPATGHNLTGGFLRAWWERGQVALFGYPISEELTEDGRTVQYFERARLEYHPDQQGTPYEIAIRTVGTPGWPRAAPSRPSSGSAGSAESPERDYFEATGHTVVYAFKSFWEYNNGLIAFGYPISEEFEEAGRTVQYFERARFEYFPEAADPAYTVQLGHLGRLVARVRDIAVAPAVRRADATEWSDSLPLETARALRARRQEEALNAAPGPVEPFQAVVTAPLAEIRSAPTTIGTRLSIVYARHILQVVGVAAGEPIDGDARWHQVASGGFIPAAHAERFTPPAPPRSWSGRWIDVNLSSFYITGYEGDRPRYCGARHGRAREPDAAGRLRHPEPRRPGDDGLGHRRLPEGPSGVLLPGERALHAVHRRQRHGAARQLLGAPLALRPLLQQRLHRHAQPGRRLVLGLRHLRHAGPHPFLSRGQTGRRRGRDEGGAALPRGSGAGD